MSPEPRLRRIVLRIAPGNRAHISRILYGDIVAPSTTNRLIHGECAPASSAIRILASLQTARAARFP